MFSPRLARPVSFVALLGSSFAAASAQSVLWESRGETAIDQLGYSIARFGDLDGDGLPEILASAPEAGQPFVYTTRPARTCIFGSASGAILQQWSGSVAGDFFGEAVADAGDVDGDGFDDAIVCVNWDDTTGYAGAVNVYSGATGALLLHLAGSSQYALLGVAVRGIGDLDNDGHDDFVATEKGTARVFAYSGANGAVLWKYAGGANSGWFQKLDVVGDLDGDGTPDLVMGVPYDHSQGTNHGAAYLLSGRTGGLIRKLVDRTSEDGFGYAVSGAGDLDGDGTPDLLVGDPYYGSPVYGSNAGAVTVFSGATGAVLFKRIGTAPYVTLGTAISECGDLDGDGIADVAMGEGIGGGHVYLYSGKSQTLLRTLSPVYAPAQLELAPDLDGDGVPDFIAGAPELYRNDFVGAGAAFTFSSANGSTIQLNKGEQRSERRGAAVAVLADIDGDTWRDVLVGSPSEEKDYSVNPPGAARILSGRDGSELRRHDGAANSDNYGERIVAIPDFTGDGVPDYAIAAPGAAYGTTAIEVRSGVDGALIYSLPNLSSGTNGRYGNDLAAGKGPNGRVVLAVADSNGTSQIQLFDMATGLLLLTTTGDSGLNYWGACVSFVGDVDGDGEGDWIGGAPATARDFGSAILFSGATGLKLRRFDGAGSYDELGSSVSGTGDLDGDGVRDVLVSAPGAANLLGEVSAFSGATGSLIFKVSGSDSHKIFGQAVASLGDVNRDGIDDFAVASPVPVGAPIGGRVDVYSGRTQGLLARLEATGQQNIGQQIATAAGGVPLTIDPDAIPDLLTGASQSYVPSDNGDVVSFRLDDLMLQADPSSVASGATISIDSRGGPAGNPAGLFAVDFSGVPLGWFVAFGTFNALGSWSLAGVVPPGLSGNSLTLRSYAIGFGGSVIDSQDATITFE